MERARRNEPGLSNKDIRQITRFDRNQARRLMQELMQENAGLQKVGERRWAWALYDPAVAGSRGSSSRREMFLTTSTSWPDLR